MSVCVGVNVGSGVYALCTSYLRNVCTWHHIICIMACFQYNTCVCISGFCIDTTLGYCDV